MAKDGQFDGIFLDQPGSLYGELCYNDKHGHSSPASVWGPGLLWIDLDAAGIKKSGQVQATSLDTDIQLPQQNRFWKRMDDYLPHGGGFSAIF
jgi:hypothetical protein